MLKAAWLTEKDISGGAAPLTARTREIVFISTCQELVQFTSEKERNVPLQDIR